MIKQVSILLIFCILQISFASACNDSLYRELKKKDINSLTQNEVSYMLSKDQACDQDKKEWEKDSVKLEQERQDSVQHEMVYQKTKLNVRSAVGLAIFLPIFITGVVLIVLFLNGVIKT